MLTRVLGWFGGFHLLTTNCSLAGASFFCTFHSGASYCTYLLSAALLVARPWSAFLLLLLLLLLLLIGPPLLLILLRRFSKSQRVKPQCCPATTSTITVTTTTTTTTTPCSSLKPPLPPPSSFFRPLSCQVKVNSFDEEDLCPILVVHPPPTDYHTDTDTDTSQGLASSTPQGAQPPPPTSSCTQTIYCSSVVTECPPPRS